MREDIMKSDNKLVDLILDVLGVDENHRPHLTTGDRTFYRKEWNTIFMSSKGIPTAFVDYGHECMHCCQQAENRLGSYTVEDREAYTGKTEGMFYKYDFEREAQTFAWVLTGKLLEMFYSKNSEKRVAYLQLEKIYSKMMKLDLSSVVSIDEMNRLQILLDEDFEKAKEKWSPIIDGFNEQFLDWFNN